jgi:hypothetical protein
MSERKRTTETIAAPTSAKKRSALRHTNHAQLEAEATIFQGKAFDMQSTLSTVLFAANGAGVAGVFNALLLGRLHYDGLILVGLALFAAGDWWALHSFFGLRDFARAHASRLKLTANLKDADAPAKEHERSANRVATRLILSQTALVLGGAIAVYSAWMTGSIERPHPPSQQPVEPAGRAKNMVQAKPAAPPALVPHQRPGAYPPR